MVTKLSNNNLWHWRTVARKKSWKLKKKLWLVKKNKQHTYNKTKKNTFTFFFVLIHCYLFHIITTQNMFVVTWNIIFICKLLIPQTSFNKLEVLHIQKASAVQYKVYGTTDDSCYYDYSRLKALFYKWTTLFVLLLGLSVTASGIDIIRNFSHIPVY